MGKRTVIIAILTMLMVAFVSMKASTTLPDQGDTKPERIKGVFVDVPPLTYQTYVNTEYGISFDYPDLLSLDLSDDYHPRCIWGGAVRPAHEIGVSGFKEMIPTWCIFADSSHESLYEYVDRKHRETDEIIKRYTAITLTSGIQAIEAKLFIHYKGAGTAPDFKGYLLIARLPNGSVVEFVTPPDDRVFNRLKASLKGV